MEEDDATGLSLDEQQGMEYSAADSGAAGAPSAEGQLLERFRVHKQHRRERETFLKKMRQQATTGGGRKAAEAVKAPLARPANVDLARVDHNNRPHRWKDASVILHEMELKSHQKTLRGPESVRPYPGPLRKRFLDEEADARATTEDDAHAAVAAAEATAADGAASTTPAAATKKKEA